MRKFCEMLVTCAVLLLTMSMVASAQTAPQKDYVESEGELSDNDFYRLVACAAPPGKKCARKMYRWKKRNITVGLVYADKAFLGGKIKRAEASIVRAVEQVNSIDFPIRMTVVPRGQPADISVYLIDTPRKQVLRTSRIPALNGVWVGNASTRIMAVGRTITATHIVFSRDLRAWAYQSIMLEEITQSLGLFTDIKNPYYETRSIFAQESNNLRKKLGRKDRVALKTHYK